jgi:hypothetical protein
MRCTALLPIRMTGPSILLLVSLKVCINVIQLYQLLTIMAEKPILERTKLGKVKPVNPLAWWFAQQLAGDEHDGLTQMALDILSTPGKCFFHNTT